VSATKPRTCAANGTGQCGGGTRTEVPYVDGERHGSETWWWGAGDRRETPYVHGKRHGTEIRWRADGTVDHVEEWAHGVRRK